MKTKYDDDLNYDIFSNLPVITPNYTTKPSDYPANIDKFLTHPTFAHPCGANHQLPFTNYRLTAAFFACNICRSVSSQTVIWG